MRITIHRKKGSKIEMDVECNDIHELHPHIKDIPISNIQKATLTESFVYSESKTIPQIKGYMNISNDYSNTVSEITDSNSYMFSVKIEGQLGDVMGMFWQLGLTGYSRVSSFAKTDRRLINALLYGTRFRDNIDKSLVLRFLSERNGGINFDSVYDTLAHMTTTDKKKLLPYIFKKLYGINPEEAEVNKKPVNKLSISNLDVKKLSSIESELMNLVGE